MDRERTFAAIGPVFIRSKHDTKKSEIIIRVPVDIETDDISDEDWEIVMNTIGALVQDQS